MPPEQHNFEPEAKPMLAAAEAAEQLGCTADYVAKLCRRGKLVGSQGPEGLQVTQESVAAFARARDAAKAEWAKQLSVARKQELRAAQPVVSARMLAAAVVAVVFLSGGAFVFASADKDKLFASAQPAALMDAVAGFFKNLFGPAQAPVAQQQAPATAVAPLSQPSASSTAVVAPVYVTNNYPVTERIVERVIASGQNTSYADMATWANILRAEWRAQVGGIYDSQQRSSADSASQDDLGDYLALAGGTLTGALTGTSATFASLTATNATVTNATTTTFALSGAGLGCAQFDANGALTSTGIECGTGSGGGGADGNWVFFNGSGIRLATTTNQVVIGQTSTSTNSKVQIVGGLTVDNATTTSATTTNLAVSNIASTSALVISGTASALLKTGTTGQVVAAVAGTDYENPLTFSYPLSRSTNTISLAFGTTTANSWNAHNIFTSLFATAASSTNATTTNLAISSLLTFGGVTGNSWDDFCTAITGGSGLCDGADATGAGGSDFAFTPTTNYDAAAVSTSTPVWFTAGLQASSTAHLVYASTTALTVSGTGFFGTASTTNLVVSGLASAIVSTNSSGAAQTTTISAPLSFSGSTLSITQANASTNGYLSSADWSVFNNKISSSSISSANSLITYNSSTGVFTASTSPTFTNATTTNLAITSHTSAILATNAQGTVVATTTLATAYLAGSLGTINGSTLTAGGTLTITAASSTLLANDNTFSGTNVFSNTISGSISGNAGTVTNGVYTTTFGDLFDNRLSASSSIAGITTLPNLSLPYSQLTGTPTIAGYPFALTGNATSTLTQFNGGLTAFASSTIGAGTAKTGLTVSGAATTTGALVVQGIGYFASEIAIGTTSATSNLTIEGDALIVGGGLILRNFESGEDGLLVEARDNIDDNSLPVVFRGNTTGLTFGVNTYGRITRFTDSRNGATYDLGIDGDSSFYISKEDSNEHALVITASDNVGIGTTSPGQALAVAGDILGSQIIGTYFTAGNATASLLPYASSTALTVSGTGYFATASSTNLTVSGIQSALLVTNSSGAASAYSGDGCMGNFVRSISATGDVTCDTVSNGDLDNATISGIELGDDLAALTATDATLTFSGSYNGSTARTVGLNLSNANTWAALQQFGSGLTSFASSTIGNGNTGLTISGAATTTGRAYFADSVGIGTTSPMSLFAISGNSANGYKSLTVSDAGANGAGISLLATGSGGRQYVLYSNIFAGNGTGNFLIRDETAGANRFAIDSNGSVGIGTTTPGSLLSLGNTGDNTINLSATATSTFGSGLNIRTGCYAVNGTCLSSGGSTLSGTVGQLAYFSGTDTAIGTSTIVISTASKVGIGTTTPSSKLSVTDSSSQIAIGYDQTRYSTIAVDSSGNLLVHTSNGLVRFTDDNVFVCQTEACPTTTATSTAGNLFVENAVTIGDGFSLRQIDSTSLGLYGVDGSLMVTFDEGI